MWLSVLSFIPTLRVSRFCGWVDVGLSEVGEREASRAGEAIVASGLRCRKVTGATRLVS